ncbi:MAG: hypothetical protein MUF56_03215 [Solirubrobacteraceae bacterium]|nr:hypothetical protein [Solirubrobacteraceae bacterium]
MSSEGQVQESEQDAAGAPEEVPQPQAAPEPEAPAPVEPAAEAAAPAEPEPQAEAATAEAQAEAPEAPAAPPKPKGKGKGRREPGRGRGRRPKVPANLPRSRAQLPLDELRDASRATLELFGRTAVRDAFQILGPRERQDISALIAQDEDHRPRARNIANGSLGAGRIDKAMSATIISMAPREELWAITLDKEQAAAKLGRVRAAKQRDQQRAERQKERLNRADRVSKEDLAKATDGTVGATIRIVSEDERRERRKKGEATPETPEKKPSVLDQLGY